MKLRTLLIGFACMCSLSLYAGREDSIYVDGVYYVVNDTARRTLSVALIDTSRVIFPHTITYNGLAYYVNEVRNSCLGLDTIKNPYIRNVITPICRDISLLDFSRLDSVSLLYITADSVVVDSLILPPNVQDFHLHYLTTVMFDRSAYSSCRCGVRKVYTSGACPMKIKLRVSPLCELLDYSSTAATEVVSGTLENRTESGVDPKHKLRKLQLPNTIKAFPYGLFSNCSNLEPIDFPDALSEINDYALGESVKFDTIRFGKNMRRLSDYWAETCGTLEYIIVDEQNPRYTSYNGSLYSKQMDTLFFVPPYWRGADSIFYLPQSVGVIAPHAASRTGALPGRKFVFSNNLKSIEDYAFYRSEFSDYIDFEKTGVSHIGRYVFNQSWIRSIKMPRTLKSVKKHSFSNTIF